MKKYILFLILITYNTMLLDAKETTTIHVEAFCSYPGNLFTKIFYTSDTDSQMYTIKINSKQLNLSQDAVEEIPSGYIRIAEDRHYLRLNEHIYNLKGIVERSRKDKINQFTSYIYNKHKKLINTKELYSLKSSKNLEYIQIITLKQGSKKTNIIDVAFDENLFTKEYNNCQQQISESKNEIYLQSLFVILFIAGLLYIFKYRKNLLQSS